MKKTIPAMLCVASALLVGCFQQPINVTLRPTAANTATALPTATTVYAAVPTVSYMVKPTATATPTVNFTYCFNPVDVPDGLPIPCGYNQISESLFAFSDITGAVQYRVYGEVMTLNGTEEIAHTSGFFVATQNKDGFTAKFFTPCNPSEDIFGIAVPMQYTGNDNPYNKLATGIGAYYYTDINGAIKIRVYASIGNSAPAFYNVDETGTVPDGALPVDTGIDIAAIAYAAENPSVPLVPASVQYANAPHYTNSNITSDMLINVNCRIPVTYVPKNLEKANSYVNNGCNFTVRDDNTYANPEAMSAFIEMMLAAKADGVYDFYLCNVYRSAEVQTNLWNKRVAANPEYGTDINVPINSAYPGTSEHQTGYAFDITCLKSKTCGPNFANTENAKWLAQNSWKYGFILRYNKIKETLTGVKYEPYHFRYVGKEIAEACYKNHWCLEEYYGCPAVWY